MEVLEITKIDEVYLKINCDRGVARELSEYFSFYVPGYKFMQAYKNRVWDGKIRLFNMQHNTLYIGLLNYVIKFAESREYSYTVNKALKKTNNYSLDYVRELIKEYDLTLEPREYQLEAVTHALNNDRGLLLSPTSSGKSLIIYLLTRYYETRTLIIVPTTSLIHQMYSDFESYGFNSEANMTKIRSSVDKNTKSPIVVATWQSIYKMPKKWFDSFGLIIGDEAHTFKAKSLVTLMEKTQEVKYKFGFTGTLDNSQTNKLVLEGLFGPVHKVISTHELIEQKFASNLHIKCLVLSYDDVIKKQCSKLTYQQEMNFLTTNDKRNNFIANLAANLQGNTLLLFQYVEKHGKVLYEILTQRYPDRSIYFIDGSVSGEERDDIRKIIETEDNAIIVASSGTTSTGVNIKKLHNIIFASPSKAIIKNLQSIGRVLRLHPDKEFATLYDIADDLKWKSKTNYTLNHFAERIKIYSNEKFDYTINNITLK